MLDNDVPDNNVLPSVSVIVPVYNGSATLPELVDRIQAALSDREFEIVLVDDDSADHSWSVIEELTAKYSYVTGIRLMRNFGQHAGLLAGIRAASGDLFITIDDDLQNPPEEIPTLLAALGPDADVVYGVPVEVAQNRWRRLAGSTVRWALRFGAGVEQSPTVSSFRAFRGTLRGAFDQPLGPGPSVDALLSWGSTRFTSVNVQHEERAVGESNYTLRQLVRFAFDTIAGYTVVPLRIASLVGLSTAGLGFLLLMFVLGRYVIEGGSIPGFPLLASAIAIFSGVQLLVLGVMGEYLGRVHFRTMNKPSYVVRDRSENR